MAVTLSFTSTDRDGGCGLPAELKDDTNMTHNTMNKILVYCLENYEILHTILTYNINGHCVFCVGEAFVLRHFNPEVERADVRLSDAIQQHGAVA